MKKTIDKMRITMAQVFNILKEVFKNRKLQFFLIWFFVLTLASQALAEVNFTKLVKKIQPAVVTIITYDMDKKILSQGSGFFVDKRGYLITNYHVLKGAYTAEVKTSDGRKHPIKLVVTENKNVDLIKVLVDIPEESVQCLKVSKAVPDVAECILVVGSPMGLEQTVSEGIVSAVREIPNMARVLQISASISPGSSGSPVINMKGKVIGVATFYLVKGQNLNFAVPGKYVLDLNRQKVGKTISEWTNGINKENLKASEELLKKGEIFVAIKEWKKAIHLFREATEKNPEYTAAWVSLAYCYWMLDESMKAIKVLKEAIRINTDEATLYNSLGLSYKRLGLYMEAIESFKQAIRIKPDYAAYYHHLAYAYRDLGLHREAIKALQQASLIEPDNFERYSIYSELGDVYFDLGLYMEAIEAFKQAIRIEADDYDVHLKIGDAYSRVVLYQDAIKAYKLAILIKPDFIDAHFALGITYLNIDNRGAALQEYKILKSLDSNLANTLFDCICSSIEE